MGGKRKYNKFAQRKRDKKEQAKNPQPKTDVRKHYAEIVRENASFEAYYKAQNICPPDEWDQFMKKLKENLPTAFRITGSKGEAGVLLDIVRGQLFSEILNAGPVSAEEGAVIADGEVEDLESKKPICLPWYPGGLAWQLQLTRSDIRRSEAYYRLHNFLTAETSSGSISRQEAVSMIPPILLNVLPHHKVLDMCASPGSKTAQLIEFLHAGDDTKVPTGFVMANDVDNNRCYMLVHQAKRLNSPCILITNHDAAFLPHLTIADSFVNEPIPSDAIKKIPLSDSKDIKPETTDESSEKETKDDKATENKLAKVKDSESDSIEAKDGDVDSKAEDKNGSISRKDVKVVSADTPGSRLLKFDRILCDVPCSGDGTLRKNADIWLKWSAGQGNNLHGVQYRIGHRGAELLCVGGRLAYSTCSLNPVECEAVILRLLREAKGALRLVEVADMLPGLKFSRGVSKWKLATKDLEFFEKFEEVPEKYHTMLRPQMFPPTPEEIELYSLDRCIRILPHHQDTGGFFVAILEKISPLPFEKKEKLETVPVTTVDIVGTKVEGSSAPWGPQRKRKRLGGYKEDPYVFFSGESEDVYPSIKEFYHLNDEFDPKCLLTRCLIGKKKNIYLVSPIVRDVVQRNEDKVKIINTGVKTFVRCDNKNMSCPFRLSQEGLPSVLPAVGAGRKVRLSREDLILLLHNDNPHCPPDIDLLTPPTREQVIDLPNGSCVLIYDQDGLRLDLVGWRGARSLRAYTARPDTVHMLRLLGEDVSKFDVNKFKKAEEGSTIDEAQEDGSLAEDVENGSLAEAVDDVAEADESSLLEDPAAPEEKSQEKMEGVEETESNGTQ